MFKISIIIVKLKKSFKFKRNNIKYFEKNPLKGGNPKNENKVIINSIVINLFI
jgi:hypothetical protein